MGREHQFTGWRSRPFDAINSEWLKLARLSGKVTEAYAERASIKQSFAQDANSLRRVRYRRKAYVR